MPADEIHLEMHRNTETRLSSVENKLGEVLITIGAFKARSTFVAALASGFVGVLTGLIPLVIQSAGK